MPPTVEAYEALADLGEKRLAEALIARHNLRMERIQQTPALRRAQILSAIAPATSLYRALLSFGADPSRPPPAPTGDWMDHLMWGVDSAVATIRLLLCGQVVGAAAISRNQLERWLLHRAHNAKLTQFDGETTADFVARVWSSTDRFHEEWFVESSVPPIVPEPHEDERPDETLDHEHVVTTDGRILCPAAIYCGLSEILHARTFSTALQWDAQGMLDDNEWTADTAAAVDIVTSAVTLSLRQIRVAVAGMAQRLRRFDVAASMKANLDSFSTSDLDGTHRDRAVRSVLRDLGVVIESSAEAPREREATTPAPGGSPLASDLVSPAITALAPLLPHEGLAPHMSVPVLASARIFERVMKGERPAGRLYTDDEVTTLAFNWQRARAIKTASAAMVYEEQTLGEQFNVDNLAGRAATWVVMTEIASLVATWLPQGAPRDSLAAAASGVRSASWLWLEDDNRSMAILRTVLEQGARLRVWRTKPAKAAALEGREATTPRDWIEKAGWKRLLPLNKALGEFAHTKTTSKWTGAHALLASLQPNAKPGEAIFTARGEALDLVSGLIAAEVLEYLREISPALGRAAGNLFEERGVTVTNSEDPEVGRVFDHAWQQREMGLGSRSDFVSATDLDPRRAKRPRRWTQASPIPKIGDASTNPFVKPGR